MIVIVDYGVGNIQAFLNIYRSLGIAAMRGQTADDLCTAEKIILPGVGAFDWAMQKLEQSGMCQTLNERVLQDKIPVLGVCVGMQMMAKSSEEGTAKGLSWINATVKQFDTNQNQEVRILPHMGWNNVNLTQSHALFDTLPSKEFYFLHSYYFEAEQDDEIVTWTNYGIDFSSAIAKNNIYATQFHPEKSHENGLYLLKNFAEKC